MLDNCVCITPVFNLITTNCKWELTLLQLLVSMGEHKLAL